jgi:hypothetical protein
MPSADGKAFASNVSYDEESVCCDKHSPSIESSTGCRCKGKQKGKGHATDDFRGFG